MRSGWWAQGAETAAFEDEFARYVGQPFMFAGMQAAAVNSGTMALELAARALMPNGGVAVVPALTFVSTALAMKHAGLRVIFADIDDQTLCIDWDDVRRKIGDNIGWTFGKGYENDILTVPVWYSGTVTRVPSDFPYQVKVLEDCAHAAGSIGAGTTGNAAAWSFQAVKNLACGDGGMVTSRDSAVIEKVKSLRWCGIDKSTFDRDNTRGYSWDYSITDDGEKGHTNDIAAAIGRVQLRHLEERNDLRASIVDTYNYAFEAVDWIRRPHISVTSSCHLYAVRVPAHDRDRLIDHLRANGVSAGVHYKPLYKYGQVFGIHPVLPKTELAWRQLVTLPCFPDLSEDDLQHVITSVLSFEPGRTS
jgi:perosamine synthetase